MIGLMVRTMAFVGVSSVVQRNSRITLKGEPAHLKQHQVQGGPESGNVERRFRKVELVLLWHGVHDLLKVMKNGLDFA